MPHRRGSELPTNAKRLSGVKSAPPVSGRTNASSHGDKERNRETARRGERALCPPPSVQQLALDRLHYALSELRQNTS